MMLDLKPKKVNLEIVFEFLKSQASYSIPLFSMEDHWTRFRAGLFTGVGQTVLFNKVDQALYLHIKNHTRFLDPSNWKNTVWHHGIQNSLVSRVVTYGFYFAGLETIQEKYDGVTGTPWADRVLAGITLGTTSAILLNPLASIKYQAWGERRNLWRTGQEMWKEGGMKAMTRGLRAVISRDATFSVTYAVCRPIIANFCGEESSYLCRFSWNSVVVAGATICSSPFNYLRNRRYSVCFRETAPTWWEIMLDLKKETLKQEGSWTRMRYIQHRFCIGWGTVRVAVAMSLGQLMYDGFMKI